MIKKNPLEMPPDFSELPVPQSEKSEDQSGVIDEDIEFGCSIDSLGNENCKANVIKGPSLDGNYIDCAYLEKFLFNF